MLGISILAALSSTMRCAEIALNACLKRSMDYSTLRSGAMSKNIEDDQYTDLLEIDTFRVVKDDKFAESAQKGCNNFTEHWIAHLCDAYLNHDDTTECTGVLDAGEIMGGHCYYCKIKIPESVIALWSMLEWQEAGEILHNDRSDLYRVTPGTP